MWPLDEHVSDEQLLRTLDGEISPARAKNVRAHVAMCQRCQTRMEELNQALYQFLELQDRELISRLPSGDGPRAILRARMAELSSSDHPDSHWSPKFVLGTACLVLVALTSAFFVFRSGPPSQSHLWEEARAIPDPKLTPGAVIAVTKQDVCSARPPYLQRTISEPVAREVFAAYGIREPAPRAYEVDFLITPALGGDANVRNFWPQPYDRIWNAHLKDALEDHLHELVCTGQIELATAQQEIAADWVRAYKKYFRTSRPLPDHLAYLRDTPWE